MNHKKKEALGTGHYLCAGVGGKNHGVGQAYLI